MQEFKVGVWFLIRLLINMLFGFQMFKLPYLVNKHKYKKQIFWECGGGYLSYYWGISQAIYEIYPQDVIQNIVWGGSSAGNVICGTLHNPDVPPSEAIQYTFDNMISVVNKEWGGGFYLINKYLNILSMHHFTKYPSYLIKDDRKFSASLHVNIICPVLSYLSFSYNFDTAEEMATAYMASQGCPLVLGELKHTLVAHPTKWYIYRVDGGCMTVPLGWLFGYEAIMPYGRNIPTSFIYLDTFRPIRWNALWVWTDVDYCKEQFKLGYNDAMNNREKLNSIIL